MFDPSYTICNAGSRLEVFESRVMRKIYFGLTERNELFEPFVHLITIRLDNPVKEKETDLEYSTLGRKEKCIKTFVGVKENLSDIGINGTIY
jgi:hypothetical protein